MLLKVMDMPDNEVVSHSVMIAFYIILPVVFAIPFGLIIRTIIFENIARKCHK